MDQAQRSIALKFKIVARRNPDMLYSTHAGHTGNTNVDLNKALPALKSTQSDSIRILGSTVARVSDKQ